jgi:hypothetical protein
MSFSAATLFSIIYFHAASDSEGIHMLGVLGIFIARRVYMARTSTEDLDCRRSLKERYQIMLTNFLWSLHKGGYG